MSAGNDIHIRVSGKAGRITLTRPQALNAMTYDMCIAIENALDEWRNDPDISIVVIDAEGSKSFCAGGDIAELYATGTAGNFEYGRKFWADEYRLNAKISNYPKPFVAIMDGIVMGGGVGISAHGSHRIVTENTMFAMPECGIGLVPDVGGNWLLSRAEGHIGEYLAATGARLGAADCIFAGIADCFVKEDDLPKLIAQLEESGDTEIISSFSDAASGGELQTNLEAINAAFSNDNAISVVQHLEAADDEFSSKSAKLMRRGCPLSVACAIDIVRQSRSFDTIEEVLELEYRFTYRSMSDGDFLEGIRAQIIDKDRNPNWEPATLEAVTPQNIANMLAELGEKTLRL